MIENLLIKHAQQWPDKPALYFNSEFLTWKQLEEQTRKMARRIGDQYKRVALITTNNIEAYKIILALIYNGTEIVFLNRRLSIDELNYQIEDSNPELILIDNNFYDDGLKGNVLSFKNIPQVLQDNFYKGPAEITSIMYTSGTTGKPKGVMQSNINHYESALNSQKNLNTTKDDVWLLVSPIFHISGFSTIMKSLFYGMAVSLYEKFDAKEVNKELVSGPATVISVVPVMLKQLLVDLGARKYNSSFKVVLLGGGPIDVETLKVTQQKNINVVQSYGMTETASQIVALDSQTAPYHIGSSGKPLNTVQLKIKKIKENDKFGNILIKSPTLTPGYLNLPGKLEKDIDSEGWFDTGDLGYLDEEGFLYVKGRLGDMINSGGENIFPVEIEDVLRKYNGVIDIVVVGIPDEKWGQIPIAFVIGDVDFEQLREFGRKHLAHYKVPNKYIKVKDFPRTASGKIQRNKLIENY